MKTPPPEPGAGAAGGRRGTHGDRSAATLWLALAVLAALRAGLVLVPTMHLWSLNLGRFLSPLPAWLPWAIAAAALVPAVARGLERPLARLGDALSRPGAPATIVAMAAAGALAWLLPDRVRFVGDFLLRQGTVEEAEKPGVIFPQAMPLDVLLHYRLPLLVTARGLADANGAARLIGALEAALFAALAIAFARAAGRRGAAAAATAAVVFFGGYLAMFTGYSKAFSELMLITVAVAVFGLQAMRTGRGLLPLGIAVALGVALHRSALSLVPALGLVWAMALRAHGASRFWRRPAALLGLAIPLAVVGGLLPRIAGDVVRWDTVHFNPAEVRAAGGPLRAAFAGGRPLDLINLVILFSPLALAAPIAALFPGRPPRPPGAAGRGGELLLLLTLAAPLVLAAPFIHPAQGLFRDWDDFAAAGVAISLVTAWLAGEALGRSTRSAWIAVPVVLGVAAPCVQWLALHADPEHGLQRVTAFVEEPPPRTPGERAKTWDYIGITAYRLERWNEAAAAFGRAAETGPSYRILLQWAMSTTNAGDLPGAVDIYHRLLAAHPDAQLGWLGLAAVSSRLADGAPAGPVRDGHLAESRRAARRLLDLEPGNPDAIRLLEYLRGTYGAERDSTGR